MLKEQTLSEPCALQRLFCNKVRNVSNVRKSKFSLCQQVITTNSNVY